MYCYVICNIKVELTYRLSVAIYTLCDNTYTYMYISESGNETIQTPALHNMYM